MEANYTRMTRARTRAGGSACVRACVRAYVRACFAHERVSLTVKRWTNKARLLQLSFRGEEDRRGPKEVLLSSCGDQIESRTRALQGRQ